MKKYYQYNISSNRTLSSTKQLYLHFSHNSQMKYQFIMMKVKIKSVIKTPYNDFQSFQDGQIIFKSGNTLCIKQIGKNECEFICLSPYLTHLFSYKPANNRKGVFTAQKVADNIEIAHYNLKGERSYIPLPSENQFFAEVQKIDLLTDEYDGGIFYGAAKNKEGSCVFLGDMSKLKILAFGYMPLFEHILVDNRQNLTLSVCWNNGNTNYIKFLRYTANQWEVQQQAFKKVHGVAIHHEILPCNRILIATKTHIYIFEDNNLLQTIELDQGQCIKQLLKINHGLLVLCEDQRIMVYVQDSDEVTFVKKGFLQLELQQKDTIFKALISNNNEDVLVRTIKNNLYSWKCENVSLQAGHFEFKLHKVQNSCASSHEGSISISTGKRFCILSGARNTTLWSIEKNQFVLSSEFISNLEAEKKKTIICSAIHPDGSSFILAFQDKIRLYKILLTKFKFFAQFPIKKCQSIVYSHGGQLVACKFGKGLNSCIQIINLLRLIQIGALKIQAEPTQIVWNELDDQIIISTDQDTVQVYRVADNTRVHNITFDQKISFVRIDYKLRRIMVSSATKLTIIDNGVIVDSIVPSVPQFHYVFPLYGMYFLATKNGQLLQSHSYKFEQFTSISLFTNSPFNMVCRNSYIVAYSSFENIMILHCQRPNNFKNKNNVDDIVMVQRDQILNFFEKVKKLESDYDILISTTQIKLEEEKNKYESSLEKFKDQFCKEMGFINRNFTEISTAKLKQEKETEQIFQKVQTQQLKYVQDIQKMYQRKCVILQQKHMDLQQKNLEQKNKFEALISELEHKYHSDVNTIRKKYEKNFDEECLRAQNKSDKILQYKQRMDFKLLELQQENQKAINQIQQNKDKNIKQLMAQNHQLEVEVRLAKNNLQLKQNGYQDLKGQFYVYQKKYAKVSQQYEESLNRIKLLEREIVGKNQMIDEKNQLITQLGEQIGGLEKAKYVLGFRTNEIRKQLQPKENLIDRLKSQLNKVDQEYKAQKGKTFQLNQKNQKFTKINEILKKQNADAKMALKLKERVFDQLCSQLFMIVNTVDAKDWNENIIKIYKTFIKEDKFKARQVKKKDQSAQELNRHLMHVQQSLNQVSSGNDKILRGKQKDITRRMRQNSQLLYQINMMKKRQKELLKNMNQLILNNDRLERELNDVYKSTKRDSTRSQTANTGITRRVAMSRDALYSREKSMLIDGLDFGKELNMKQVQKQRSRIGSAHKTLMFKDAKRQKSAKFFDIAKELQTARNTIKIQDQMIQELNHRLFNEEGS